MAWILVVDDDQEFLRAVAKLLRYAGHRVDEARSGVAAVRSALEQPPDLVLTDINMPDMNGLEVIQELRRIRPWLRIIAVSGGGRLSSDLLLRNADSLGAIATVSKPLDQGALIRTIDAALTAEPATCGPSPTQGAP